MNYSSNFGLRKPERNEQFNLDDWNDNTDAIDSAMQTNKANIATQTSSLSTLLSNLTSNDNKADTSSTFYKLFKLIYPVGSLYWSSKSTNPANLFGGTWSQIKDRFVLACGDTYETTGTTGGASSVTLTVSNMPSHSHSFTPSGTISMNAHNHGLNNHAHNFTPNGNISSDGSHYHYFEFRDDSASWSDTKSSSILNAHHGINNKNVMYNSNTIIQGASVVEYPNVPSVNYGTGVCFDTESNNRAAPVNKYLVNGFQGCTSWSGYHSHSFTGTGGTTSGNNGNTTNTTTSGTFSGTAGTTGTTGSGTSFSILPPYVVKYCWERTA